MPVTDKTLLSLTEQLMEEVKNYGILEVSTEQYQTVCNNIIRFADESGTKRFSSDLIDKYLTYLDSDANKENWCAEYRRFQKRVVRMLTSLAETGKVDFSTTRPPTKKYSVPANILGLIENILDTLPISEKTESDLRGPIRHLFWYALNQGLQPDQMDDITVLRFLIDEVPVTNGGSTGRTLRCVKYVTEYLKSHGNSNIKHDYRQLTLKNEHRRIIPAFSEEEISCISAVIDPDTSVGKRDLAIVLLAFCTGFRGADIVRIQLSDVDWRGQKVSITQSKTHVPVIAELNGTTMNAVADYVLEARPDCGIPELFVTTKAPYRALSSCFGGMIDKYCEKAGVDKIPFRAFHSLRRSFETIMVSRGVPIETASQMMGHRTINEDKPYITHDKGKISFVAMGFSDVPITAGFYAKAFASSPAGNGGDGK